MKKAKVIFFLVANLASYAILNSLQAFTIDEYPTTGIVYNTMEDSSITYSCTKTQNDLLECEFVQVSVRNKLKPEEAKQKFEDAKKQFPDALKELSSSKSCDFVNLMLNVLEERETPEKAAQNAPKEAVSDKEYFIRAIKKMSKPEKEDNLISIRAANEFCTTHSEESYFKAMKIQIDKELRTCNIVSYLPFKQTFKWVSDYASGAGAWVTDSKAEGPCGIVQLSRFEFEPSSFQTDKNKKFGFWKYYAKKAIINPKGKILPGFSCSDMDEREYLYDWKKERHYKLDCEYIDFSPI